MSTRSILGCLSVALILSSSLLGCASRETEESESNESNATSAQPGTTRALSRDDVYTRLVHDCGPYLATDGTRAIELFAGTDTRSGSVADHRNDKESLAVCTEDDETCHRKGHFRLTDGPTFNLELFHTPESAMPFETLQLVFRKTDTATGPVSVIDLKATDGLLQATNCGVD